MSQIFNLRAEEGIGIVTFDIVGDAMNTWTDAAFEDFDRLMGDVEKEKGLKGLIFISGKPENFLSGANLKTMAQVESADVARTILNTFHGCFTRMGRLGYPVIAAIHGHCLGGGLEFALACTARIGRASCRERVSSVV